MFPTRASSLKHSTRLLLHFCWNTLRLTRVGHKGSSLKHSAHLLPLLVWQQAQKRGTRGKAGAKMSDAEDEVAHFLTCRDHNTLLFVSDRGVAYGLRAFQARGNQCDCCSTLQCQRCGNCAAAAARAYSAVTAVYVVVSLQHMQCCHCSTCSLSRQHAPDSQPLLRLERMSLVDRWQQMRAHGKCTACAVSPLRT